jgi:hypothetical protein
MGSRALATTLKTMPVWSGKKTAYTSDFTRLNEWRPGLAILSTASRIETPFMLGPVHLFIARDEA